MQLAQASQPAPSKAHLEESIAKSTDADCARAESNLREWRSYLPEVCINTMIQMGWHLST